MNVLSISLKNYLSFRNAKVELTEEDGIFLVIGRNDETVDESDGNGSGKTAFMGAVRFALFGSSRGEFSKDLLNEDVIYKNENDEVSDGCEVEIECAHGGSYYRVNRSVRKNGAQTLELYTSPDRCEWVCGTLKAGVNKRTEKRESGIVRTQDKIRDLFGFDDELFTNSAYFEQANIDTFARGSLTEKDNIFKSAIGISRWADYHILMKDDLSQTLALEKSKAAILDDIGEKEVLEKRIETAEQILRGMEEDKAIAKKEQDEAQKTLKSLIKLDLKEQNKLETLIADTQKNEEKRNQLAFLQVDIPRKEVQLKDVERKELQTKKEIETVTIELAKIQVDAKKLKAEIEACGTTEETLEQIDGEYDKEKETEIVSAARMRTIKDEMTDLINAVCPLGLECEAITEDKKEEIKERYRSEWKKQKLINERAKGKVDSLLEKRNKISECAEKKSQVDVLREKYVRRVDDKKAGQKRLEYTLEAKAELEASLDKLRSEFTRLEKELSETNDEAVYECRQNIVNFKKKIQAVEMQLMDIARSIEAATKEENECLRDIEIAKTALDKYKKLEKEFAALQDKKELIKGAMYVVNKDIPHILISQSIPEIQDYVREFISQLSGGRLDMEFRMTKSLKTKVDGENSEVNAFDPWVCIDGRWLKYQQTSGGERARADVAIHLAWVCFISTRSSMKIETLFLDEVGAALDKSGIDKLIEILQSIMEQYGFRKIFYITQSPDAKKMLDRRIQITKTTDGSKVEVI